MQIKDKEERVKILINKIEKLNAFFIKMEKETREDDNFVDTSGYLNVIIDSTRLFFDSIIKDIDDEK